MQPNKARADLWTDLALVAFLIGFDVAARLLPHAPDFTPVAASALFAGRDAAHPGAGADRAARRRCCSATRAARLRRLADHGWWSMPRIALPARGRHAVAALSRRRARSSPAMLSCSLIFFAAIEFRGLGVQRHVHRSTWQGLIAVLRRGAAVPDKTRARRSVLDRGAVRRRLAGAAPTARRALHAARDLSRSSFRTQPRQQRR